MVYLDEVLLIAQPIDLTPYILPTSSMTIGFTGAYGHGDRQAMFLQGYIPTGLRVFDFAIFSITV